MSGTANEYDSPGANYPDREDVAGVEPEPAEQRSDAGVGGAIHDDAAADADVQPVQNEPVLEQNLASNQERIDGIVAQTRSDLGGESDDRYAEVLRQRLRDADIEMTDEDRQRLAEKANPGSGGGGA